MNVFFILLKALKCMTIESMKKPIVVLYNIYCLIIFILYNNTFLNKISPQYSSDKINMILFFLVIISSILLKKKNSDCFGCMLFFNNISFCLINIIWLLYMIIRILLFGIMEALSVYKDKSQNLGLTEISLSLLTFFATGGFFNVYNVVTWIGLGIKGYNYYTKEDKLQSFIQSIDSHFKEKQLDFLYIYVIIFGLNVVFLIIIIFLNILYEIYHNIQDFSPKGYLKEKSY